MHCISQRLRGHGPYQEAIALMCRPADIEGEWLDLSDGRFGPIVLYSVDYYLAGSPVNQTKTLRALMKVDQVSVPVAQRSLFAIPILLMVGLNLGV